VEEIGGPGENHRPVAGHWQALSHNVAHLALIDIRPYNISVDRAKELLTFCLEPHCKCDPVNEYVTYSGLDFVPKIPDVVHNLIVAYNNFSEGR
jgi:hypothetical protein